ncbi:MAG: hypothetical protein KAY22_01735 [Rhizorhabdus sp.]|uniref:hypothetical protein n=1 Tax=Rhizorhabdus sp. TaxID=1968843 RepID=UPI001B72AC65|nr:hypothetical protein [Rhizorhabdus sp.]MBP8231001.1 hypothetical protein [Rhizorhabdus sp.]
MTKRKRPRTPKIDSAPPESQSITIAVPDTDNTEETKRSLSASIPGWADLSEDQRAELAEIAIAQRKIRQPVQVTLSERPGGGKSIGLGKCEAQGLLKLQKAFAAVSIDPVNARANELLKYLGSVGADTEARYNAALSFIESMAPQNQAEALLLVQMYVTHDAAIRALSQIGSAEWVPHVQTFGNLATKLLRTSQGQMETLARMRRGGEQVVRHIHVDNRGGQAVITENLHTGGRETAKNADQSHAIGSGDSDRSAALPSPDPLGWGVPVPGREGETPLQDARRDESGSADR